MAEFSFSKSLLGNKKRGALTGSHVAYGLFVLICCWAGAQMLSMLIHAPGVFERLMQARGRQPSASRHQPRRGYPLWSDPFPDRLHVHRGTGAYRALASAPLTPRHTVCPPLINPFRKPRRRQISGDFWTLQLDPSATSPAAGFCPSFSRRDGKPADRDRSSQTPGLSPFFN